MIKVYLSNDGSTWVHKYPSTSPYANQELSSFVEADNLRVYQQIAFANSSPTKMTITVGGYSSCLTPFKENKYIKVQEDSTVVFIGVEASSTETVTSNATRDLSIIYDDLSYGWKDLKFGDIPSLEVTTPVVMPTPNPYISFDAEQSKVVINKYITELDYHIARTGTDAFLNQQLINEKAYWVNVLKSYNGQGGIAKHELKITKNDHIKVCDGNDKHHSMVHKLFALMTDLQVETSYRDTTEVKFFYAMDEDSLLDTICEFLAQNGLGWYIDYPNSCIKVVSYDSSITATTVQNVELKAQIKTDSTKLASVNEQFNAQFIADCKITNDAPFTKMFDRSKLFDDTYSYLTLESPWVYNGRNSAYPTPVDRRYLYNGTEYNANIPQIGSIQPDVDVKTIKKRFFWEKRPENSVYDKSSKSWRQYPYLYGVEGGDFFVSDTYFKASPLFLVGFPDEYDDNHAIAQIIVFYVDSDGTIKYAFASNKTGVQEEHGAFENTYSGFSYLRVFGNITKATWSTVDYASSYDGLRTDSDDVTKLQYIYSTEGMHRFRKANYWYRLSDAQSWTFSSCDEYSIMDSLRISGVDDTYVLITKKEKHLEDGTFKYTCVKAPTKVFSYNGQGIVTNELTAFDPTGFYYTIGRVVELDASGNPKDDSPVRVSVEAQYDYTNLSATYNNVDLELKTVGGSTWFEIPVSMLSQYENHGFIINTYGDYETVKVFSIDKVMDGAKGVTYIPSVTASGVISWTNDGDRQNPSPVNIKGENGTNGAYTEYEFAKTTSPNVHPSTGWQDAPMDVGDGEYLWMRQRRVTF